MQRACIIGLVVAGLAVGSGIGTGMESAGLAGATTQPGEGQVMRVPVEISGGHETDPRDHGRPVALIAAALGVPEGVFREAFSHVRPAPAGERPAEAQVRQNKRALLKALAKYGVSNERLDEVSDYYRYRPEPGHLWRHAPASAIARVEGGRVTGVTLSDEGAGYSSPPRLSVPGHPEVRLAATLALGKDLKTNGRIDTILIASPTTTPATQP
jgi:hypothetical protein